VAEITRALNARGLRAEADTRNEKINYKVREHSLGKVPVILAIGQREVAERTVSARRLGENKTETLSFEAILDTLAAEAVPPDLR
jgi:threonyl-tRNA synthetase